MAVNINVTEDENSIDINDVSTFTVHVKDLSVPGSIQVSQEASDISEDTVNSTTEIRTIDLPADSPVAVSINQVDTTTVTVNTSETNVIEVSDNVSIVTAATRAATRKLRGVTAVDSIWDQSGLNAHYTDGNVGIGTSSPSHPLDVNGNVNATSFTGTFVGALSSSAQIAGDISGALGNLSTTVTTNQNDISANQSNISANQTNISANQSNINDALSRLDNIQTFTGSLSQSVVNNKSGIVSNLSLIQNQIQASSSFQSRITDVEAGSTSKTLISGSSQIATEISGAFTFASSSISSRLSSVEAGSTSKTLISGSSQIATEISGAFTETSRSLQSRLAKVEVGSTSKTLISGSGQIATEISGAFNTISSSLQARLSEDETRLTAIESELENTLISGSNQIATEISGAFNTISSSLESRASVLESKVGQDVNTTSNVEFNIISASNIRIDEDLQIQGDMGIGGTIFGLTGFGVTIDDIAVVSGSTHFGSGSNPAITTHTRTGSMNITGSLDVTGPISATSFVGIFNGVISSSAQIATEVSGAFTKVSSSIQSRLTGIESELENTLISGSAQIATEISGAINIVSASLQSRITDVEAGSTSKTLISGSAQIATEVSGAFNIISSSLQTRLTGVETELSNTLISGSSQLSTEISGAFTQPSSSISSRLTTIESELGNTLISSSAQIAADISGAFKNIDFNDDTNLSVVVYDNTAKKFHFTGSYGGASTSTTGTTTQYALSSVATPIDLTKLVINDYTSDGSVGVITDGGILQLTFGSPTIPYFTNFNAIGFDANRFNKEIDDYKLNIDFDLTGNTFIKGELSASTSNEPAIGVAEFANGVDVDINSTLPSYQSGSHVFTAKITSTLASGDVHTAIEVLDLQLNKTNPTNPTIRFNAFNIPGNSYLEEDMEIEEGANGSIDFQLIEGDGDGWTAATPHNSSFNSTLTVNTTGDVTTGTLEEYWNSGTDNNPAISYTGSVSRTWSRVRSLRFKTDTGGTLPSESDLQNLTAWSGTIKAGFNNKSEIESVVMNFTPTDVINGEFIFIIYDNNLGNLTSITNISSTYEEISMFDVATIGGYKVYKKRDPGVFNMSYQVKF